MAAPKRQPQRSCVACRQAREKRALIRVVRTPECRVEVDTQGRAPGRGAYLCRTAACLERALKTKSIERALGCPLNEESVSRLREAVSR